MHPYTNIIHYFSRFLSGDTCSFSYRVKVVVKTVVLTIATRLAPQAFSTGVVDSLRKSFVLCSPRNRKNDIVNFRHPKRTEFI